MESEFIALDKAGEEAEWLQNLMEYIPMWPKPIMAICIHCDSQAALARAKNAVYNEATPTSDVEPELLVGGDVEPKLLVGGDEENDRLQACMGRCLRLLLVLEPKSELDDGRPP
ncbi:hypothetical protein CK203_114890 [Vitis vinifera]|uniref:Uncharacterized protein n=1 Tax=Vitis vinifera TaxID=29760 RepID=A0A438D8Z8_VITVI|nr:hypothetical protein CK203_114890 [Vitis vinifera]